MELLCKIGSQGLPDGRCISIGETYEVDDVTASTLIAAGYAEAVSAPHPIVEPDIVDIPIDAECSDDHEPDPSVDGGEPDTLQETSTDETDSLADLDTETATTDAKVPEPPKKKRIYKRRA